MHCERFFVYSAAIAHLFCRPRVLALQSSAVFDRRASAAGQGGRLGQCAAGGGARESRESLAAACAKGLCPAACAMPVAHADAAGCTALLLMCQSAGVSMG